MLRVLVIDDDRMVARVILRTLRGCQVDLADDAVTALQLAQERSYDVVLCDLSMPDLDGQQVLARLRAAGTGLEHRFILMTGGAFTADGAAQVEAFGVPVVEKPMTQQEIWAAVEAVLSPEQRRELNR